ncbi:hypothetical protein [Kroppenstedtia guangzhouensis]|jgi:hypothetical protein|uniref:hypothetical protein n=1 Tax=Kroppenstedtia guangzhouensis TaxID=1274356 RepID=UPI001666A47E|nr:hypothetical protein [Kroppenstedtia guangzhouensis]
MTVSDGSETAGKGWKHPVSRKVRGRGLLCSSVMDQKGLLIDGLFFWNIQEIPHIGGVSRHIFFLRVR